jgi:hypothetical protein
MYNFKNKTTMRTKNFTFLTLALLMMSVVAFAQKPAAKQHVTTPNQQMKEVARLGKLTKDYFGAFHFTSNALPEMWQKTNDQVSPEMLRPKSFGTKKGASRAPKTDVPASLDAALNADGGTLHFESTGDYVWEPAVLNDVACAKSTNSGVASSSCVLTAEVTLTQDGALSFDFIASGEGTSTAWDACVFSVDGTEKFKYGGHNTDWESYSVNLTAGTHTLTWSYTKDGSVNPTGDFFAVKNVALGEAEPVIVPEVVTPPSTLMTEDWTFAGRITDGTNSANVETTIQVGFDGNDVYVQGFGFYISDAWVKGTLSADGNSITFESGQYYGAVGSSDVYFVVYDTNTGSLASSVTVAYDATNGTMTWPSGMMLLENGKANEAYAYAWYNLITYIIRGGAPDPLTPPTGIEEIAVEYQMVAVGFDSNDNDLDDYRIPVYIAVDGNDVWVKGVCQDWPDAWIKGTLSGTTVTFPTGQHFNPVPMSGYEWFFSACDGSGNIQPTMTMTFDSETGIYSKTDPAFMLINGAWLTLDYYLAFSSVQFVPVPDVAATPAQPEITYFGQVGGYDVVDVNIPLKDEDGNPLKASKLSYKYYYEVDHTATPLTLTTDLYTKLTENMTEIPYNFTDDWDIFNTRLYLNMDFSTWNRIGIQSIYRGGGDEHASEIFWYVINPYSFVVTFSGTIPNTIENGFATVTVDGTDATLDADSKLTVQSGSEVAIKVKKDYKFDQISASDGTTITTDANATNASFTMPENDVTISYSIREIGKNIKFATDGEFSIQNGQATVEVNGSDVTDVISASGTLQDVPAGSQVELATLPGYKFSNVSATYVQPAGGGGGGAGGDLTVYDGSASNGYVPVYGFYADAYLKCETVMPASELTAMAGSTINAMKFYLALSASGPWTSTFKVFMKEVSETTLGAYSGLEGATVVYEGTLDATGETMDIEFTTPYQYNGGNLLIGIYNIEEGNYKSAAFYGTEATGASVQGYSYTSLDDVSLNVRDFIPKTTFTYSAGGGAAADVQIGEGDQTSSYLPSYTLYNYSLTQQIYTVEEIAAAGGSPGNINSIAFNALTERTRNIDIYLVHTRKDAFADNTDWIAVTASDKVFSGEVTFAAGDWTTITFDTPFNYNGVDNLAVIVDDNTGSWISGGSFKVYDAPNQAIRVYSDDTNYDPENPAYNGTLMNYKDQIILNMQTGGSAPEPVAIEDLTVTLDNISFTMPNGNVTLNYTIEHPGTEITVPAGAYITYYTDKAIMTYDTDVQLMTVSSVTDNAVNVTEETVVPNETPMLIYNGTDADKTVWLSYADELGITVGTVTTAAEFKGTLDAKTFTEDEMAAKDYYVCTGQNFVWVRSAGTIGANKCWIELTKDAPKNARPIVLDGEATGIDTVVKGSALENGVWYDLNGRRLQGAPTQKGVYVINGKKVVIK